VKPCLSTFRRNVLPLSLGLKSKLSLTRKNQAASLLTDILLPLSEGNKFLRNVDKLLSDVISQKILVTLHSHSCVNLKSIIALLAA
jgi:hypothetical protein